MNNPDEKDRRKALKKAWKLDEQSKLEKSLPMSKTDFKALFDHLDKALVDPCDHTLRMTTDLLKEKGLPHDKVNSWLQDHGGHCDCEVLANVEGELETMLAHRDA